MTEIENQNPKLESSPKLIGGSFLISHLEKSKNLLEKISMMPPASASLIPASSSASTIPQLPRSASTPNPNAPSSLHGVVNNPSQLHGAVNGSGQSRTPIKSYSDYMRSLASKYQDSEVTIPPPSRIDPLTERFQLSGAGLCGDLNESQKQLPSSLTPGILPPTSTPQAMSLLNFPNPFGLNLGQQQQPNSISAALTALLNNNNKDNQASPHQQPQSQFPFMEHLSLLNFARAAMASAAGLSQPSGSQPLNPQQLLSSVSEPTEKTKKRRRTSSSSDLKENGSGSSVITTTPLDLSGSSISPKRPKLEQEKEDVKKTVIPKEETLEINAEILNLSVEGVVEFVTEVPGCSEFAKNFSDHSIDGSSLTLLTEDHMTQKLDMRLGPALRLRAAILKKLLVAGQGAGSNHGEGAGSNPGQGVCMHCAHCYGKLQSAILSASDKKEPMKGGDTKNEPATSVKQKSNESVEETKNE